MASVSEKKLHDPCKVSHVLLAFLKKNDLECLVFVLCACGVQTLAEVRRLMGNARSLSLFCKELLEKGAPESSVKIFKASFEKERTNEPPPWNFRILLPFDLKDPAVEADSENYENPDEELEYSLVRLCFT